MRDIYYSCARCGSDMVLTKGKYSYYCACEKRFIKNRDFDEKRCKNFILIKDMEMIKAHINFCEGEGLLETGYSTNLFGIQISVGFMDDSEINIFVDNQRSGKT